MPLPFIIGGLAALGSAIGGAGAGAVIAGTATAVGGAALHGIVNYGVQGAIEDYEQELNHINEKMEVLCEETNFLVETSKENFDTTFESLNELKSMVYDSTIKNCGKVFGQIMEGTVICSDNLELQIACKNWENSMARYRDNSVAEWGFKINPFITGPILGAGGIVISFVRGIQIQYEIDAAKAEYARLKAECEKIKARCVKLDDLTNTCDDIYETIDVLQNLTDIFIDEVETIVEESGNRVTCYSEKERNCVMAAFNCACALNDLICEDIFDAEGNLNLKFNKTFEEAKSRIRERRLG